MDFFFSNLPMPVHFVLFPCGCEVPGDPVWPPRPLPAKGLTLVMVVNVCDRGPAAARRRSPGAMALSHPASASVAGWTDGLEGGQMMVDLGPADPSGFLSHRITTDMPKVHKIERRHDCVPTWFCPFKRGAVLLLKRFFCFQETLLKRTGRGVSKKSFPRCSFDVKNSLNKRGSLVHAPLAAREIASTPRGKTKNSFIIKHLSSSSMGRQAERRL